MSITSMPPHLELVNESKIAPLLSHYLVLLSHYSVGDRFEASGVCVKDSDFYVIFDNIPHIACIKHTLSVGATQHRVFLEPAIPLPPQGKKRQAPSFEEGFEDIAFHKESRRFWCLVEASEFSSEVYKPRVVEFDEDLHCVDILWIDCPLKRENKGLEGVTYIHRDGIDYLLGLCEGNRCEGGDEGRIPGHGRIQVFKRGPQQWEHVTTLKIPKTAVFEDYAAIDVADNRVVVVSQSSAAIWVGTLEQAGWGFVDDGMVYPFPMHYAHEVIYCNVEGVAWMAADQIVVVSDRAKDSDNPRCQHKEGAIHIFRLCD